MWQGWTLQEWTYQHGMARVDNAGVDNAGVAVRDNAARTNNILESFHASLRRRMKVAHPNLYAFLGHLQRVTVNNQADITRLDRGLRIRRPKTNRSLVNDSRIKTCINRYDSGAYVYTDAVLGRHES